MSASIRVPFRAHFDFRALPQIRVLESFQFAGYAYAGVQNGLWQYDEHYWSERKGAFSGSFPMPARETVANLRLGGATRETIGDLAEPVDRVASGSSLIAQGEIMYRYNFYDLGVPNGATEHRLYSCATGALVASAGFGGALGPVPDGSYMLWARTFAGDPFETGHGLARIKDGEWSALRVQVGAGAWTLAAGVIPSPGAALYRKTNNSDEVAITGDNDAAYRVPFDPLARSVSASEVLSQDIRKRDGTFFVNAGSQLLGGLRISASGPQTALWILHSDGTARVLGLQAEFTDGVCECAKTNHHASDVVQSPDGDLFVLTECALFKFNPDAASEYQALEGYPAQSLTPEDIMLSEGSSREAGHPGGNCLRFPKSNEMIHWTEDLTGREQGNELFYNRIVRRVSGRDVLGPGTLWHGTNCADTYLGRFWAIRGQRTPDVENEGSLYLDWLDNGQWHGYSGMKRSMRTTFWQRLKSTRGVLFVFGFNPTEAVPIDDDNHAGSLPPLEEGEEVDPTLTQPQGGAQSDSDTPVCAIADGLQLREASFPYFIRRATVVSDGNLFVAARDGDEGIGPANRVVEIDTENGGSTRICSLWNESAKAFQMSRADFTALGGDVAKLPAFFAWMPMSGTNGGGKWKATAVLPTSGYWLETSSTSTLIKFSAKPGGTMPYDVAQFDLLCFEILSDGSIDTENGPDIEPTCTNAQCALDSLPDGTKFRVVQRPVHNSEAGVSAIQITDASNDKRLGFARDVGATLWARYDSTAPLNDLSSYTHLVNYGRLITLATEAKTSIEVVVLVKPTDAPLAAHELHHVSRRT
ncbi:hypothetical protein EON83_17280 [bacterium]|nr:MAG: hypothetical protein EON83_17280 [bacterium]